MNRSTRALTAIMLISCSAMATAQEAPRALRRIGNLATVSECPAAPIFLEAMAAHGWIEGRTLSIECVSAIGRIQDLPKLATELVGRQPEVILAVSTPAVRAVKAATTTIPVVGITQDPVREGFVDNLSRPGGNITGVAQMGIGLASKRIEILKEILPGLKRLAVVARQGGDPFYLAELKRELETATRTFGLVWGTTNISRPEDIEGVLRQLRDEQYDAVYLVADPITFVNAHAIAESANRMALPVIAEFPAFVRAGILVSYGVDQQATTKQLADYVDKILRGAKPGDLPIEQPSRIVFAINLRTARVLGINPPGSLLARADEVID